MLAPFHELLLIWLFNGKPATNAIVDIDATCIPYRDDHAKWIDNYH